MRNRKLIVLPVAIVIAGLIGGLVATRETSATAPTPDAISYTQQRGHVSTLPDSLTPDQVIEAIVKRSGSTQIVSTRIGQPPAVVGARTGIYLDFVVDVPSEDERVNKPQWEADLVQGAIAEVFASRGSSLVVGSRFDWRLPGGSVAENMGGGMGDIVAGQHYSSDSDATIRASLSAKLLTSDLEQLSIDVLHADQPAPAVVARTSDPQAAAAEAASIVRALFGQNPPTYEGYYFEVQNLAGEPVYIQSAAFRTGAGRQWVSPQVAGAISLSRG